MQTDATWFSVTLSVPVPRVTGLGTCSGNSSSEIEECFSNDSRSLTGDESQDVAAVSCGKIQL